MSIHDIVRDYTSTDLQNYFQTHAIERPVCLPDPDSELDLLFQATCYTLHIPGSHGTIYNLAWTQKFFTLLEPDCLVIDVSIVAGFNKYLEKRGERLTCTHLICIGAESVTDAPVVCPQIQYQNYQYVTFLYATAT